MSEIKQILVPDVGGNEVEIIEILVEVGDSVELEQGVVSVETEKATMDIPAPFAGVITEITAAVGGKIKQGDSIGSIQVVATESDAEPAKPEAPPGAKVEEPAVEEPKQDAAAISPAPTEKKPPLPPVEIPENGSIYASPSVRRVAREFGVNLTLVTGSGRKGRILKSDVKSYVKQQLSGAGSGAAAGGLQVLPARAVDFEKFGEIEEVPLTRIQKISGPNLHRNWVTIPHVTQFDEADITDLEVFRKEQNAIVQKKDMGFKISPLVFVMKAAASALDAYPVFASSLSVDGESLIMKRYCHIGVAVDTPNGLVVPVVRDVDKKGVYELSKELLEISIKAREGQLSMEEMQGSCFTISSLGGIGGTAFTPIVNAPDVAILGVSRSEMKPKWDGAEFVPRLMLPLSLSYDHRVIDGAIAARFIVHLSGIMTDLKRLIL